MPKLDKLALEEVVDLLEKKDFKFPFWAFLSYPKEW